MIRAVIFDLGGVLIRGPEPQARREWAANRGIEPSELERTVFASDLAVAAYRGRLSPEAYWRGIAERLGVSEPEIQALQEILFRDERLDTELLALIRELRQAGYRVGALSNATTDLERKLREVLGIYDLFDAVIISGQVGFMKPEIEIFRAAAAALGVSVAECAFIDDNTANVDGAHSAGMRALRYHDGLDVRAALRPLLEADATCAIIFDYGNVLDIPEDHEAWLAHREALAARFGVSGEALGALVFQSEPWHQVKVAAITYDAYLDAIWRPLGVMSPTEQQAAQRAFFTGRERLHPAMRALLYELKPRYRLALLSNAYQLDMTRWLIEEQGLEGVFDAVISSAAVRLAKPDPAIYRLTLERLGVQPGEALFIDDLARNTMAAETIGLPSIVFTSPDQIRGELQARKLI